MRTLKKGIFEMKKNLIIIGAGGFGREALGYAYDCQTSDEKCEWEIKGFIDDDLSKLDEIDTFGYDVIGTVGDHEVSDENVYILAIADMKIKEKIAVDFLRRNAHFINLIHPAANLTGTVSMGVGNIFCPYASVSANVNVGNFVTVNAFSTFGHDVVVEDYVTVSSHCDITGNAVLKKSCFLGSHAVICPSAVVGSCARVGAGSVVLKQVASDATVFGVPAKKII